MNELARIVEALLFLSPEPLSASELADAAEVGEGEVVEAIARLREHYAEGFRGVVLREVAGGFTLATDPVAERAARRLLARPRTPPLTQAQAECMAITAYLQPVSRPEVARILIDAQTVDDVLRRNPLFAALDRGSGIYNVCDDDPAPMSEWLPVFAKAIGAKPPRRVPVWLASLVAGKEIAGQATRLRGASNAKAKRELGWQPRYPSWRQGFREALG